MKKKENIKRSLIYGILIVLVAGFFLSSYFIFFYNPYKFKGEGPIKIFWLNSYHAESFGLANDNIEAFEKVFEENGVEIEIRQLDMDVFRDASQENIESKSAQAKEMIEKWNPDLIYATDDPAQEHVISKNYVNSKYPVVFSGLNDYPKKYGYDKAKNVAGTLERVHFAEVVNLLSDLFPGIEKIGILGSGFVLWDLFMDQMKAEQEKFPEIEFLGWDKFPIYEDFQDKILEYQKTVDALIFLGIDDIVDSEGNIVPRNVSVRWMVENSKIPDATFWNFYAQDGTLLTVDVSPEEQGKSAGVIAYKILIEGKKPKDFEFEPTKKGKQNINLARAELFNLKIPSVVLINSKIYKKFPWEK